MADHDPPNNDGESMTELQARQLILQFGDPSTYGNLSQEEKEELAKATQIVTVNYNIGNMLVWGACILLQNTYYRNVPANLSLSQAFELAQKYQHLGDLLPTFGHLSNYDYYQRMWENGLQRFKLEDNEAFFSLHDRSTSLSIFIDSSPGANDNHFRALLPLDSRRAFAGSKNPNEAQAQDAEYQALGTNWPSDTKKKDGDPPLPDGRKQSRQRSRCLACGFNASLAWRRRETLDRNFCQNFYCPQKARDKFDRSGEYPGDIKRDHSKKDKDKKNSGGAAGTKRKRSKGSGAERRGKRGAFGMATAPAPLIGS